MLYDDPCSFVCMPWHFFIIFSIVKQFSVVRIQFSSRCSPFISFIFHFAPRTTIMDMPLGSSMLEIKKEMWHRSRSWDIISMNSQLTMVLKRNETVNFSKILCRPLWPPLDTLFYYFHLQIHFLRSNCFSTLHTHSREDIYYSIIFAQFSILLAHNGFVEMLLNVARTPTEARRDSCDKRPSRTDAPRLMKNFNSFQGF